MKSNDFVERHIAECVRAAVVDANGDREKAVRLRAQARLRLICMTDKDIWELAEKFASPSRNTAQAFHDIKRTVAEYKASADEWVHRTIIETAAQSKRPNPSEQ